MEQSETPQLVAWMPGIRPGEGYKNRVAQLVGAVRIPMGQELPDTRMYLEFLADRVQAMIEAAEHPGSALAELIRQLEDAELMGLSPESLKEAGHALIMENPTLQMRLGELGVPGRLPKKIYGGNPEAKRLVNETGLETWTAHVLNRPNVPR